MIWRMILQVTVAVSLSSVIYLINTYQFLFYKEIVKMHWCPVTPQNTPSSALPPSLKISCPKF
jgi:hypothetical protein